MPNHLTVIHIKPFRHFGAFSNKCTKSKKLPLKSDTITYLFGFNGKEKIDEINGAGNDLDFGDRLYSSRIGNWLSVDPLFKEYPGLSPYISFGNNPLFFIDKNGDDIIVYFAEDKLKKYPAIVIKTNQINQTYTLPEGMRETIMTKVDPKSTFPTTPLINIELPNMDFMSDGKTADAKVTSVGGVATVLGGFYASFDFVSINKGRDKGATFAYFTFGAGFGGEIGVGTTEGSTGFNENSGKTLDRYTFTGASKIFSGGALFAAGNYTTGYSESEIMCMNPIGDCGYTPTYTTKSLGVATGLKLGAGIYNTQSYLLGTIQDPPVPNKSNKGSNE